MKTALSLFLTTLILFWTWVSIGKDLPKFDSSIDLYLFHSEDCSKCQSIIPSLSSRIEAMYPSVRVLLFDLKEPKNYEALRRFEKAIGRKGDELPFAVIGDRLLSGEKEITESLDPVILEFLIKGTPAVSEKTIETPTYKTPPIAVSAQLIYLSQSGCPKCGRTDVLLDYLLRKYPGLSIKTVDLSTPEGKLEGEAISTRIGLPENIRLTAPALLIGETFLTSKEISEERIEEIILNLKESPSSLIIAPEEIQKAERSIIERFKSLGLIPVAFGGLIDGLNPCAFATLVFLVSYLAMTGSKKKEILKIGLGFTGSVFLTYFLIGLGLVSFIQHFPFTPFLSRGIYFLALAFALVMGGLSFYDFLLWKKGREREMKLQLPNFLKKLTHKTIKGLDLLKYQLAGAIFMGFAVSLFEFTCTGQVYLPTIIFVMGVSELKRDALFYLFLYNLAFIVPLLLIFALFYLGVSQRRFSLFLQRRGPLVKLLTSIFFFSLGALMLLTAL